MPCPNCKSECWVDADDGSHFMCESCGWLDPEPKNHPPGTWFLAPAADPTNEWAAGYSDNVFATREEALAAIPGLLASGPEFEIVWVALQRGAPWPV